VRIIFSSIINQKSQWKNPIFVERSRMMLDCENNLPKVVFLLRNLIGACHFLAFQFSFAVDISNPTETE